MAFSFPDMMILGEQGHLRPYDVRFDPADAAYLSAYPDGALRLRLLTEAGFTEAAVNEADGHLVPMHRVARSTRFDVWEVRYVPRRRRFRYTFALRDADRRAVYLVPAGIGNAVERLDRWEIDLDDIAPLDVPEWARGAVIYQIFPERFADGDPSLSPDEAMPWGSAPHWLEFQGGDLVGIADKADHLAGLGVGMVYLNPIFRSPSTHRYDVIDYYEVDPALGGNDALRRLVGALHERDIKVIVDASFNHCHPQFFAFADVMEKGPASEYAAWFVVTDHPPRVGYRPDQVRARFDQADAYDRYIARFRDEAKMNVEVLEGEGPPVELTYEAWYGVPSLPRIDLTNPGARDYFLEVARHWVREYDVDGWRMDVARYVDFAFWPRFRQAVKEVRPDAYLIAEIMGDAMPWLQGDTFDATMNYTFRQLVLDFVADPVGGGVDFADGFVSMWGRYAPEVLEASQNLLGSHDKARFLHEAGEDRAALRLATVLQMTLPGAPGLYYGDEIGMTGGEEPGSRGAFPWHDEGSWDLDQLELVRALGRLRVDRPSLRRGTLAFVHTAEETVAYVREVDGERTLIVVNRDEAKAAIDLPDASGVTEVLLGDGVVEPSGRLALAGRSAVVVAL